MPNDGISCHYGFSNHMLASVPVPESVARRCGSSKPSFPCCCEQQAVAIIGMTEGKAGEHLIQSASPKLWNDLVRCDRIVTASRKALD